MTPGSTYHRPRTDRSRARHRPHRHRPRPRAPAQRRQPRRHPPRRRRLRRQRRRGHPRARRRPPPPRARAAGDDDRAPVRARLGHRPPRRSDHPAPPDRHDGCADPRCSLATLGWVTRTRSETSDDQQSGGLSEPMAAALAAFETHLAVERDLSAHTVRAYLADVTSLATHASRLGITEPAGSTCARCAAGWPTSRSPAARAPRSRAGPPPRGCSPPGWRAPTGPTPTTAPASARPKARRTLPPVLRADEAAQLVGGAAGPADDDDPVGMRDAAMLELLYATGIRVGELVALDVDDVDRERNLVRVFGKGRKERSVPFGHPAARALDRWLTAGRPSLVAEGAGAALFVGARGRRIDQRAVRTLVHRRIAEVPGRPGHRTPRAAAHRGHPPARGRGRPASRAGDARSREPGDDAALHPRDDRPAAPGLPAGAPPGLDRRRRPGDQRLEPDAARWRTAVDHGTRHQPATGAPATGASRHSGSSRTGPAPTRSSGSR